MPLRKQQAYLAGSLPGLARSCRRHGCCSVHQRWLGSRLSGAEPCFTERLFCCPLWVESLRAQSLCLGMSSERCGLRSRARRAVRLCGTGQVRVCWSRDFVRSLQTAGHFFSGASAQSFGFCFHALAWPWVREQSFFCTRTNHAVGCLRVVVVQVRIVVETFSSCPLSFAVSAVCVSSLSAPGVSGLGMRHVEDLFLSPAAPHPCPLSSPRYLDA